ncbi:MAG: hypothetical protein L3J91_03255, partial [Thermoplasmata archaeon]|nr:hypothetical protein [Thermoplasmata archaeon]
MAEWMRSIDGVFGWLGPVLVLLLLGALPGLPAGGPGAAVGLASESHTAARLGDFSVEISAFPAVAEPGIQVVFTAQPLGGSPPYRVLWTDSLNGTGSGGNFTAASPVAGNLSVTATVDDSTGARAASTYNEAVVGGLVADIAATNVSDVGLPFSLVLNVAGGVPPYAILVSVDGGAPDESSVARPGVQSYLVKADASGAVNVSGTLTDAIGASLELRSFPGTVAPRPLIGVVAGPTAVEVGVPYVWWASVAGGTPPFVWSVGCLGASPSCSEPLAAGAPSGSVGWSGRFNGSGNGSIVLGVVDTAGASSTLDLPLRVAPSLDARLFLPAGGSGPSVNVSVLGGVPPYDLVLSASDGESWFGNASGSGALAWTLDPRSFTGGN